MALKRTEIFNYENEEYFTNYNSGSFELKISTSELAIMEMYM